MFKKILYLVMLLILNASLVLACGGNCLDCHPNLNLDVSEHKVIKGCINCQKKGCNAEEQEYVKKGEENNVGCGADCFQCHSFKKIIALKNHQVINRCIDCHKNIAN